MFQTVLNFSGKIQPFLNNFIGHLLMTEGRKNCSSMARETEASVKRLYRYFRESVDDQMIEKSLYPTTWHDMLINGSGLFLIVKNRPGHVIQQTLRS